MQERGENTYWFGYARQALSEGLKALGVGTNDVILFPESICDVVLTSCKQLKLKVSYYKLKDDLTPDWESVISLVNPDVKALLLVHYFGFPQDIEKAVCLCRAHNLFLIEDNAHGYGTTYKSKMLGTFGDIGISSPRKNIGRLLNGALLWINSERASTKDIDVNLPLEPLSCSVIVKLLLKKCLYSCNIPVSRLKKHVWNSKETPGENEFLAFGIDTITVNQIMSIDITSLRKSRQIIYNYWREWTSKRGLMPIYCNLTEEINPYCFPCYANTHSEQKHWLEWGAKHNLDIFAWPSLPKSQMKSGSAARSRWERLLCFPINPEIAVSRYVEDIFDK